MANDQVVYRRKPERGVMTYMEIERFRLLAKQAFTKLNAYEEYEMVDALCDQAQRADRKSMTQASSMTQQPDATPRENP